MKLPQTLITPVLYVENIHYAVYDPAPVNVRIVLDPEVVTAGDPVVVPVYLAVGIDKITTP
jgi:hypothetical protein